MTTRLMLLFLGAVVLSVGMFILGRCTSDDLYTKYRDRAISLWAFEHQRCKMVSGDGNSVDYFCTFPDDGEINKAFENYPEKPIKY